MVSTSTTITVPSSTPRAMLIGRVPQSLQTRPTPCLANGLPRDAASGGVNQFITGVTEGDRTPDLLGHNQAL